MAKSAYVEIRDLQFHVDGRNHAATFALIGEDGELCRLEIGVDHVAPVQAIYQQAFVNLISVLESALAHARRLSEHPTPPLQ